MPRKIPAFDFDDAVKRYVAGESAREIAASIGISRDALDRRFRAAGVPKQRDTAWHGEVVRLHHDGLNQAEIVARLGRPQPSVSKVLLAHGIRADRSIAAQRRADAMTPEQRKAITAAANEAARGMTFTEESMARRARTRQERLIGDTGDEDAIGAVLAAAGENPIPQQAVGKYNLDLGVAPVAVELFGGGWHAHGRHRARLPERVMYLADAGFNLHITWTRVDHSLDPLAVAEDVLAYLEVSRRDPAFRRQYRVIWGSGQFISAGCVDDDELALIPTGIRGTHTRRR